MWVRLIAILIAMVFVINGCNSLISQFFGTHKLRTFTMDQVLEEGLGDADYVSIEHAWQTGDYLVVPPRTEADKAVLLYPILSAGQLDSLDAGRAVQPRIIAWTKEFDLACDEETLCAPRSEVNLSGIIREMNKTKKRAHMLPEVKYRLPENVIYLEEGRQPLAWYWNLLMMLGGLGFAFFIESRAHWRKQIGG
jgi:hypothetical protein